MRVLTGWKSQQLRSPDSRAGAPGGYVTLPKSGALPREVDFGIQLSNAFLLRNCHSACGSRSHGGDSDLLDGDRKPFPSPVTESCGLRRGYGLYRAVLLHLRGSTPAGGAQAPDDVV